MSLVISVSVNGREDKGTVTVTRMSELASPRWSADPGEDWSAARDEEQHYYEVHLGDLRVGRVRHRYGDGALALASSALALAAIEERGHEKTGRRHDGR